MSKEKVFFTLGEVLEANKESKSLIIDSENFTDEELEIAIHKKKDIYNSSLFYYRDVYGDLLYKIDVTYQPHQKVVYKDVTGENPEKIESIIYNVDRVIYSKVVIIVNDEIQADLLNTILPEGYIATCPFFTFDKFREWKESYNEYLNKQKIFIICDEYFDSHKFHSDKIKKEIEKKIKDVSIVAFDKNLSLFNYLQTCKFEQIKDIITDNFHKKDLEESDFKTASNKLKALGYKFSIDTIRKNAKCFFPDGKEVEVSDDIISYIYIECQQVKELNKYKQSFFKNLISSGHPFLYDYYDPFFEYLEKVKFLYNPKQNHSYIKEYVSYLKTTNKITHTKESQDKLKELYGINVQIDAEHHIDPYPFFRQWFLQLIYCGLGKKGNITGFILEGKKKGTGKTTFNTFIYPEKLNKIYYLDGIPELDNKDGDISLSNMLYINMDEINQKNSLGNWNKIKSYLSKEIVNVRIPYAASNSLMVRRASVSGSMNGSDFLKEMEDRRFFIFSVDSAEHEKIREFATIPIYQDFTKTDYMYSEAYFLFRKEQEEFSRGKLKDSQLSHHVPEWLKKLSYINNENYRDLSLDEELVNIYLREENEPKKVCSYLTIYNHIIENQPTIQNQIKQKELSKAIKNKFGDMVSVRIGNEVTKGYRVKLHKPSTF